MKTDGTFQTVNGKRNRWARIHYTKENDTEKGGGGRVTEAYDF